MGVRLPPGAHPKIKMKKAKIKREYSAGGIVYKKEDGKIGWLVVQPSAEDQLWRQGRWQLPKGWIDEGETSQQAAVREVKEELKEKMKGLVYKSPIPPDVKPPLYQLPQMLAEE